MSIASVKQIAEACGVSKPTVSLILNNKGQRYSAETREKVLAAAQRLGYLPNSSARAMAKGQVDAIGLLIGTDLPSSLVGNIMPGIQDELRRRNLHLTVAQLPDVKLTDAGFVPRILREYAVAGFLIGYTHNFPPAMADLIERHNIPSVWMNNRREYDAVYPDDIGGARTLTEQLIGLGHRSIAYLTHSFGEHYSHVDREAGYTQAMQGAGLTPQVMCSGHYLEGPKVLEFLDEHLSHQPRPTAFVAYGPRDAVNVITWLELHGVRVPQDVSVCTFATDNAEFLGRSVSIMTLPFHAVGERAVQLLMDRIAGGDPAPAVAVPASWSPGATHGPAGKNT